MCLAKSQRNISPPLSANWVMVNLHLEDSFLIRDVLDIFFFDYDAIDYLHRFRRCFSMILLYPKKKGQRGLQGRL